MGEVYLLGGYFVKAEAQAMQVAVVRAGHR